MSKADKMLRSLGYVINESNNEIIYINENIKTGFIQAIIFDKNVKRVWMPVFPLEPERVACLCAKTIEAINIKTKELDWLE